MRSLAVWVVGSVYVLAALTGAAAVVWAADHEDNSSTPTHWAISAAVVFTPIALAGALASDRTQALLRAAQGRRAIVIAALASAVAALLIVGARAIVVDANACSDDDCVTLSIPVAVACVLGAWSLPFALWMLRRSRYPAAVTSAGIIAASITLLAGVAAALQLAGQEDNFADLALGTVLPLWVVPAAVAVVAVSLIHAQPNAVGHHTAASRVAATSLIAAGIWLVVLPFAAQVDTDSFPVMLAVCAAPGVVLSAVGLAALRRRI